MNVWEENKFKRDVIKIVPRIIENLRTRKVDVALLTILQVLVWHRIFKSICLSMSEYLNGYLQGI